jgi:hypothetical protein
MAAGALVALGLLGGCRNGGECGYGPSMVVLELPAHTWRLTEFCLDDDCPPPVRRPDSADPVDAATLARSYAIEVPDTAREHRYRVKITTPAGTPVTREGSVTTKEILGSGEYCRPAKFLARLIVGDDDAVTVYAR